MNKKIKKSLHLIGTLVFALVFFAGFDIATTVPRGLPTIYGELAGLPLSQPVTVTRDENGVAHIVAANDRDLFIAQGFVHAQDRLFQMDLARRQATGTLAQVLGSGMVAQDRHMRTMLLGHYAQLSEQVQPQEVLDILGWYAQGVNTFIEMATSSGELPVEFHLLGYEPHHWEIHDSLALVKLKAFDMAGHWHSQAFRAYIVQNFSSEKAHELFPVVFEHDPFIINFDLDMTSLLQNAPLPREHYGSNNWVVAGARTASGAPILTNDPHLSLTTPSIWYHNRLYGGSFDVAGVSIPGVPAVILGHNRYIAWGATNTGPDVQDLFIERRNPDNPNQFLFMEQWEDATVLQERIYIQDADPYDFEIAITRHGPIISDDGQEQNTALSLKWTAHAPTQELQAIFGFNRATDWDSFSYYAQFITAPTQNFAFAAIDGTIALKVVGQIPIRANDRIPLLPAQGYTGENDWIGYIPIDQMPMVLNPEQGFVSSANNKVISDQYPYFLGMHWAQPYRQMRIHQVLDQSYNLTIEDMSALMYDTKNLQAEQLLPKMLDTLSTYPISPSVSAAINYLSQWDYFDTTDQIAPTIFHIWLLELADYIFARHISPPVNISLAGFVTNHLLQSFDSEPFGEPTLWIEHSGGLEHVLHASLESAVDYITSRFGNDTSDWVWGNFHAVAFFHPLSGIEPLGDIFNPLGTMPAPGSGITVNMAAFDRAGIVRSGASWRLAIDMADTSVSYGLVAPGNSGHPMSEFYHSNINRWLLGELYQTDLNMPQGAVLVLEP